MSPVAEWPNGTRSTARRSWLRVLVLTPLLATMLAACGSDSGTAVTLYSGRSEAQVQPLLKAFTKETGINVKVRYGASAELAAQLAEEGGRSPADLFWAQDAGALDSVDSQALFATAPPTAGAVEPPFKAADGTWVGLTGRARVIVYNPDKVAAGDLPSSISALTDPRWRGRVAIAPTNGSFQAFVTAMRLQWGEQPTREWLAGIKDNGPKVYEDNAMIVAAVNAAEVDVGLVNHYYLYQLAAEIGQDKLVARNHYTSPGDPGSLVNVAGIGILKGSGQPTRAARLVDFLLGPLAQRYFAEKNFEYPLIPGVPTVAGLVPLSQIQSPDVNLSDLSSLDQTLTLMREVGLL